MRLLAGPFRDARDRNSRYILSLPQDRLLHSFRVNAGLPSSAQPLGGWEKPDCELRGHFTGGHYLTACALLYAATGEEVFKERANAMVAELAKCQKALGSGYLSAFPEELFDRLRNGVKVWAPFYTYHKILAGLLDVSLYCGNPQALAMAEGMAAWVRNYTKGLSDAHMERILTIEYGGMNAVLYDLAAVTGKEDYRELAHRFDQKAFFDPLAARRDELTGLHANTQFPKVIGAARRYELTGEQRYRDIAEFFWARGDGAARLLHGRDERRRALADAARRAVDGAVLLLGGMLLRVQHAEADAPHLRLDRGPARRRLLRAHAVEPPARDAEPGRRHAHVLLPARVRVLEVLRHAALRVLVLHGDRRGGVREGRRLDLLSRRPGHLREPVHPVRGALAREGAAPAPGDGFPRREPSDLHVRGGPSRRNDAAPSGALVGHAGRAR